jgi:hypothetical protein
MIHFHCSHCGLKFKVKDEHSRSLDEVPDVQASDPGAERWSSRGRWLTARLPVPLYLEPSYARLRTDRRQFGEHASYKLVGAHVLRSG